MAADSPTHSDEGSDHDRTCHHGAVVARARIVFVTSPHANAFFGEMTLALVEALAERNVDVAVTADPSRFDVSERDVFVLLPPHEYVQLEGSAFVDDPVIAERTIGISAEQPSDEFFALNVPLARRLGAVVDFSGLAVEAYLAEGIVAHHLEWGYVPSWDHFDTRRDRAAPTIPVLYLGNGRPRRLRILAGAADALAGRRAVLRISDSSEANAVDSPSFLSGNRKRELLARTGLLVNVHQGTDQYFEWLRFADAAHCGVPLLTEPARNSEPFVAGEHYFTFEPDRLGQRIDELVGDTEALEHVARAAYEEVRRRPLVENVGVLVDLAEELRQRPPVDRLPAGSGRAPGRERRDPLPRASWRPSRRSALRRRLGATAGRSSTLLAPPGTRFREQAPVLSDGELLTTFIVDGADATGVPTLEGVWPWEPWRLRYGQHLGRTMVVDDELIKATHRWISEPWVAEHEHVAVQLFAVVHGIIGTHVPRPIARVQGSALDPSHRMAEHVAARCRHILDGD